MNHNWDVHSNTEIDTCVICTLKRKMKAQIKGMLFITGMMFREYWVHNRWMQAHESGRIGRVCPGIETDYNTINIQK